MKEYRVFLASSYQLKTERDEFEKELSRLNDDLVKKNARLKAVIWEKLDGGNDPVRKQNFYNEELETCDILVLAYWGQLGQFTNEEYQKAMQRFQDTGLPRIYVFKKTLPPTFDLNPQNVENLAALEKVLYKKDEEQWPGEFKHPVEFIKKISDDIRSLFNDPANQDFVYGSPAKLLSPKGVENPNVFVGREDELKLIRERLDDCGKLMLINAEGGIGKTTLAARYWNESLYDYQHNAWLFCENGIVNALKELAPKLNVDLTGLDEAQQLAALHLSLSEVHDDFLLVLDNANEMEDIRDFRREFEGSHWHVLITSRCQGVLDSQQELPITHLPPLLAKELFEMYYPQKDELGFDALLERLLKAIDYNTLLIEIFAKNLSEASELGMTLTDFLQKLEIQGLYLGEDSFEIESRYTSYVKKKAANTDDILDILYDFSQLSEEQRYLLVNIALLPSEGYTILFLIELFVPENGKIFHATIKGLYLKGWLGGGDKTYRLSPVVQKIILEKNKSTSWEDAKFLMHRFTELMEYEPELDNANTKFKWLSLSRLIASQFENIRDLAHIEFMICRALVLYGSETRENLIEAERIFRKVLGSHVFLYGNQSLEVATTQSTLASILTSLGRVSDLIEIENILRSSVAISTLIEGISDTTFSYQSNLAVFLTASSGHTYSAETEAKLMEAEILLREVLKLSINNYGEEHFRVAEARSNLAMVLRKSAKLLQKSKKVNRLAEAEQLMRKALTSDIKWYKKEVPMIGLRKNNLALVLTEIGGRINLLEAEKLLIYSIDNYILNFGDTHPKLIEPVWNLYLVYYHLGDVDKGKKWINFVYPISERNLSENHYVRQAIRRHYNALM